MTNEEVAAAVAAGSLTVNDKTVELAKKGDETDTWCIPLRNCHLLHRLRILLCGFHNERRTAHR